MFKVYSLQSKGGFTLVEVLVGIFLTLVIFLGIFGAFYLSFKIIEMTEKKVTATAIAQGWIEKIRNLSYEEVGTIDAYPTPPYARGILESSTTTTLNGVEYHVSITVQYIADEADGLASPGDNCPNDYKRAEVKVSWSDFREEITLATDVAPKDLSQECEVTGGILSVLVFDAYGNPLSNPLIEIKNPETFETIISATPASGKYNFPLASSTYKVVVSKSSGYSVDQTYGINEIAIPEKPNPIVLEGQITQISFSIDKVSSMRVKTLSTWSENYFSDSFLDETKISKKENVVVGEGEVKLATSEEGYLSSGSLFSISISPDDLIEWGQLSFSDKEPSGTDLKYQVYFASGTNWVLIPDADLPGNSLGFDSSPLDLSHLSTTTYSQIKLKANFSTNSTSQTPTLEDWQVSWKTTLPLPISNVSFNLRGEKIIGRDLQENPVYKFSTTTQTNNQGEFTFSNLEWDIYHFSNFKKDSQDLTLMKATPELPISLNPDSHVEAQLFLASQNSLLVIVEDATTLEPIFSATTVLSLPGFSLTQYTNENGQTIFLPLSSQSYNLSVSAPGYFSTSTTVFVSGQTTKLIKLKISD